jgi:hypothetical protein
MKLQPSNLTLVIDYTIKQVNSYTSNLVAGNTVAIPTTTLESKVAILPPQGSVVVTDVKKMFTVTSWSPVKLVLTVNSVSIELACSGVFVYTGAIDEVVIINPTTDLQLNVQYVAC